MKRQIGIWELWGFAVTSILGTLLHFLYEWLGKSLWIAPFSAVNESTWEHMKLLFWAMLIYAIAQSFFFADNKNFWCIKLKGILIGLTLIPIIFYTYNGAIGKSPDWINISIFFVSAAIAYIYETRLFNEKYKCKSQILSVIVICMLSLLFIIFTFKTPEIEIFKDPISGIYGI